MRFVNREVLNLVRDIANATQLDFNYVERCLYQACEEVIEDTVDHKIEEILGRLHNVEHSLKNHIEAGV